MVKIRVFAFLFLWTFALASDLGCDPGVADDPFVVLQATASAASSGSQGREATSSSGNSPRFQPPPPEFGGYPQYPPWMQPTEWDSACLGLGVAMADIHRGGMAPGLGAAQVTILPRLVPGQGPVQGHSGLHLVGGEDPLRARGFGWAADAPEERVGQP
ncbi:hypothetical protein PAPYR_7815 [Paratrimastix pyriformis]|uniref:Uncharacterized protein n=1 Tax=Paratrimastix pyriformis TaxID=342808 RepID=A0ABQ8UG82_9EUKA|nr:hypothetical protein PAPYR_7815 [Paratrimastix pyriformis]